jgi:cytochrome oxidase assembly protein ShyY1
MSTEPDSLTPEVETKDSHALRVIGWFSIGMAVAALGIYVGAELRSRYKFKRRTPYDFYSNAGEQQANEFGMGV